MLAPSQADMMPPVPPQLRWIRSRTGINVLLGREPGGLGKRRWKRSRTGINVLFEREPGAVPCDINRHVLCRR